MRRRVYRMQGRDLNRVNMKSWGHKIYAINWFSYFRDSPTKYQTLEVDLGVGGEFEKGQLLKILKRSFLLVNLKDWIMIRNSSTSPMTRVYLELVQ